VPRTGGGGEKEKPTFLDAQKGFSSYGKIKRKEGKIGPVISRVKGEEGFHRRAAHQKMFIVTGEMGRR